MQDFEVWEGGVGKDTIKSRLFKEMYFRFCIYSDKCTNTQSSIIVFHTLIDVHCYDLGAERKVATLFLQTFDNIGGRFEGMIV